MPNIAQALKAEIERIAKKALRTETTSLKKASATHRSEIVALKRRAHELEQKSADDCDRQQTRYSDRH